MADAKNSDSNSNPDRNSDRENDADNIQDHVRKKIERLGLDKLDRHIFLCCDQSKAKCCDHSLGLVSWEHLKHRVNLINAQGNVRLCRTKANCLRVCDQGPIAVVYPDGVWYHSCTIEVLDKIIDQHLVGGKIVEEYRLC